MYPLVKVTDVSLARVAYYRRERRKGKALKQKQATVTASTLAIANRYLEKQKLYEDCKRLRREIRLATRGAPLTEELDSVTGVQFESNEQLYAVRTVLVKNAYRKLAPLVHPDRGGTEEQFHAVNTAYKLRDLEQLIDIWVTLVNEKNLEWVCGPEGQQYVAQEVQRPRVQEQVLRTTPEHTIMRSHLTGNEAGASALAKSFIELLYQQLVNELHYTRSRNGQGRSQGIDQEEAEEKGRRSQDQEVRPAGEGAREGHELQEEGHEGKGRGHEEGQGSEGQG